MSALATRAISCSAWPNGERGYSAAGRYGRADRPQRLHRFERIPGGAAQQRIVRLRERALERLPRVHPAAHLERVHVAERERRRLALHARAASAARRRRRAADSGPSRRPADSGSASRRACSSRRACRSPCSPARRNASACDRASRWRARWPATCCPRAASARPCAGAGRRSRRARWRRPGAPGRGTAIVGRRR